MKFTINKNDLNTAIQHVSKAVSGRMVIPILTGIKIDAQPDAVTLTASDTTITIESRIPIETIGAVEQPGSIVLPAKFFVEIVKKLPKDEVLISVKDLQATIKSGRTELQLSGLDATEFPRLPSVDGSTSFSLPAAELRDLIRSTTFAVSDNESTPILTGALWSMEDGLFRSLATDRHRMAWLAKDSGLSTSFPDIVIPGKDLLELAKLLPDKNGMVDISFADSQLHFRTGNVQFFARALDGRFPDTSKLVPDYFKTELVIDTKSFEGAIERAYTLSKEEKTNIVRLTTTETGGIEITSSNPQIGRTVEELSVELLKGEEIKVSFNSKYMLDALKVIDTADTFIGFNGATSPIIIKPFDGPDALHLVLPYRTVG